MSFERRNISLPKGLHRRVMEAAGYGARFSSLLAELLEKYLADKAKEKRK